MWGRWMKRFHCTRKPLRGCARCACALASPLASPRLTSRTLKLLYLFPYHHLPQLHAGFAAHKDVIHAEYDMVHALHETGRIDEAIELCKAAHTKCSLEYGEKDEETESFTELLEDLDVHEEVVVVEVQGRVPELYDHPVDERRAAAVEEEIAIPDQKYGKVLEAYTPT